jgi:hypothetical protein
MTEITLEQAVKISRESGARDTLYGLTIWGEDAIHAFAKAIQAQTRREVPEYSVLVTPGVVEFGAGLLNEQIAEAVVNLVLLLKLAQEQSNPVQQEKS